MYNKKKSKYYDFPGRVCNSFELVTDLEGEV